MYVKYGIEVDFEEDCIPLVIIDPEPDDLQNGEIIDTGDCMDYKHICEYCLSIVHNDYYLYHEDGRFSVELYFIDEDGKSTLIHQLAAEVDHNTPYGFECYGC